jgi:hypothetical protein
LHLHPREGVSVGVWKKIKEDTVVLVGTPTKHEDRPISGRGQLAYVRAKMPNTTVVKEIKPGVCRVVYVCQVDAGGRVPIAVMNLTLLRMLALTYRVAERFQGRRGLESWDAEDGKAMAEMFMVKVDAEKHRSRGETRAEVRVRVMMEKQRGLRELGETWDWMEVLLAKVVANKLRPAGDSGVKLCNMSRKHAEVVGGGLASGIAANLTAQAAVEEWILRYPAMAELELE